jgi:glycosyltransferase involved in cell wall biosynthesis
MTQYPNISVLIPSFNQAKYLVKTLASVAKQDYPRIEVIIADGGSRDETAEVVRAYGELVSKFRCAPDHGQLDGLGRTIEMATGDICFWLNSDDVVMPGVFHVVAEAFRDDPALDIVFSDDFAFEEPARKLFVGSTVRFLDFWNHFLFYGQMYSECVYWRRSISTHAYPLDYSLRVYSDYSFFLPLRYGRKCRWLSKRLGAFRNRPTSQWQMHRDKGEAERELVKERMRQRLSLSLEDYQRLQRRYRLAFWLRLRCYPKVQSAFRFGLRKITGDFQRKKTASWFFDEWLQPPRNIVNKLGPALCRASEQSD